MIRYLLNRTVVNIDFHHCQTHHTLITHHYHKYSYSIAIQLGNRLVLMKYQLKTHHCHIIFTTWTPHILWKCLSTTAFDYDQPGLLNNNSNSDHFVLNITMLHHKIHHACITHHYPYLNRSKFKYIISKIKKEKYPIRLTNKQTTMEKVINRLQTNRTIENWFALIQKPISIMLLSTQSISVHLYY